MNPVIRPDVKVINAPGYADFEAKLVCCFENPHVALVEFEWDGQREIVVVPRTCIHPLPVATKENPMTFIDHTDASDLTLGERIIVQYAGAWVTGKVVSLALCGDDETDIQVILHLIDTDRWITIDFKPTDNVQYAPYQPEKTP